jgi:hypothetical protein
MGSWFPPAESILSLPEGLAHHERYARAPFIQITSEGIKKSEPTQLLQAR